MNTHYIHIIVADNTNSPPSDLWPEASVHGRLFREHCFDTLFLTRGKSSSGAVQASALLIPPEPQSLFPHAAIIDSSRSLTASA
jgi:hypothetical protein